CQACYQIDFGVCISHQVIGAVYISPGAEQHGIRISRVAGVGRFRATERIADALFGAGRSDVIYVDYRRDLIYLREITLLGLGGRVNNASARKVEGLPDTKAFANLVL